MKQPNHVDGKWPESFLINKSIQPQPQQPPPIPLQLAASGNFPLSEMDLILKFNSHPPNSISWQQIEPEIITKENLIRIGVKARSPIFKHQIIVRQQQQNPQHHLQQPSLKTSQHQQQQQQMRFQSNPDYQIKEIDCFPIVYEIYSRCPSQYWRNLNGIFIMDRGQIAIMFPRKSMTTSSSIPTAIVWLANFAYPLSTSSLRSNHWIELNESILQFDQIISIQFDSPFLFILNRKLKIFCLNIFTESHQIQLPIEMMNDHFRKFIVGNGFLIALNTNHLNPINGNLEDRFVDIAGFRDGFAILTEKQLIFLYGHCSNQVRLSFPSEFLRIDLKIMFFRTFHESFHMDRMFASKNQLILLSNNHKMFVINLDRQYEQIPTTMNTQHQFSISFLNDHRNFRQIYAHYSNNDFVIIGHDNDKKDEWQTWLATIESQSANHQSIFLRKTTLFQSISDAYAMFVNGETPNFVETFATIDNNLIICREQHRFNDPTNDGSIRLSIKNRIYFIDSTLCLNKWNSESLQKFLANFPPNIIHAYLRYLHNNGIFNVDYDYFLWVRRFIDSIQSFDQLFYHSAVFSNLEQQKQKQQHGKYLVIEKLSDINTQQTEIPPTLFTPVKVEIPNQNPVTYFNPTLSSAKTSPMVAATTVRKAPIRQRILPQEKHEPTTTTIVQPIQPLLNRIEDYTQWPILNDICHYDSRFLTENLEQIFICDNGRIAIIQQLFIRNFGMMTEGQQHHQSIKPLSLMAENNYLSYRYVAWFATYVYERSPMVPWINLDHLDQSRRIVWITYDNGWLFTMDNQNCLRCRNIFVPSFTSIPAKNENDCVERFRKLFPLMGEEEWPDIKRCSTGESYTLLLTKSNELFLWKWLFNHSIISNPEKLRVWEGFLIHEEFMPTLFTVEDSDDDRQLIDIACFQHGFALLTSTLIFLFGRISPRLDFGKDYLPIIIRDTFERMINVNEQKTVNEPLKFARIFATRNRLLLLSEDGQLYYLQVDLFDGQNPNTYRLPKAHPPLLPIMSDQRMRVTDVFATNDCYSFLATMTDKYHKNRTRILVFLSRQSEQNLEFPECSFVETYGRSIPDAYSLWINGETPMLTTIPTTISLQKLQEQCQGFQNPNNPNNEIISIHNRAFYVDQLRIDLARKWPPERFTEIFSEYPINFAHAYLRYLHTGRFELDASFSQLQRRFMGDIQAETVLRTINKTKTNAETKIRNNK
ncbi:hypothetical protein DERF_005898 [Dermatophagoides farinae]|uniref:Uncharacterized protein n=1 Tax=Dermatophagoides farinae TaxID=6954 RepID=A0A922I6R9_DERFA|nr:hypothetical protein DERF_005898 [Dermatophagoides farinae]